MPSWRGVLCVCLLAVLAVPLWVALSAWAKPPGIVVHTTQDNSTIPRTLTEAATVAYNGDGTLTVEVRRTAVFRSYDRMAAAVEGGSIEQEQQVFDGLFGLNVDAAYTTLSQSLVTSDVATSTVTAQDTAVWRVESASVGLALYWWPPTDFARGTSTLTVLVQGGVIVGMSGLPVPAHSDVSISLTTPTFTSSEVWIALVRDGASAAQAPVFSQGLYLPGQQTTSAPTLGSLAARGAECLAAGALGMPVLLALWRGGLGHPTLRALPAGVLALASGAAAALTTLPWGNWEPSTVLLLLAAFVMPLLVRAIAGTGRPKHGMLLAAWSNSVVALTFIVAVAVSVDLPMTSRRPGPSLEADAAALAAALGLAICSRNPYPRLFAAAVPGVAIAYAADESNLGALSLDQGGYIQWLATAAFPAALFAISAVALAIAAARLRLVPRPVHLIVAAAASTPLIGLFGSGQVYWSSAPQAIMYAGVLTAFVAAVMVLWQDGHRPAAVIEARSAYAGAALVAVACCGLGWNTLWWAGICTVIAVVSVAAMLPRSRYRRALLLAKVDQAAHLNHVLALQHAKTKADVDRRYHQDGAADIAQDKLTMEEYLKVSRRLRRESAEAGHPRRIELALGTYAGESPWGSAMAGLAFGSLIGLPLMLVTIVRSSASTWSAEQAGSIAALVMIIVHTARWAVLGLVYGYFYPLLRGRSAFPKAGWFAAALLPVELAATWLGQSGSSAASVLGIAAVQLCAFCAVLALAWEFRQARRAGVGWDGIRNLRSLRMLAAPAGAVSLALVTAAVTTLANTEIPTWVAPQQTAVAPHAAATPSASPNAGSGP